MAFGLDFPVDVSMKAQPISMGKPPMQDASQS